uniref:Transmembrane protein 109 n=1 Tax=Sus scrofa TaxID=9823 RepID=A0A5G2RAI4_PIG
MAGAGSSSPPGTHLFKVILMVLLALVLLHSVSCQSHRDFVSPGQQKKEAPVDLLSQIGRSVRGTLDAWIGPETTHLVSETLAQVMWAISSAISVAFFALSGIAAQLLNALGLEGDHLTQGLKLSPGQVQTFLLWGAGALVAYWLLSLLLGLVLALLGRILWGLKLVLFLAAFVALVSSAFAKSPASCLMGSLLPALPSSQTTVSAGMLPSPPLPEWELLSSGLGGGAQSRRRRRRRRRQQRRCASLPFSFSRSSLGAEAACRLSPPHQSPGGSGWPPLPGPAHDVKRKEMPSSYC